MRTLVAHVSLALGTLLHSIKDNRRVDGEEGLLSRLAREAHLSGSS